MSRLVYLSFATSLLTLSISVANFLSNQASTCHHFSQPCLGTDEFPAGTTSLIDYIPPSDASAPSDTIPLIGRWR